MRSFYHKFRNVRRRRNWFYVGCWYSINTQIYLREKKQKDQISTQEEEDEDRFDYDRQSSRENSGDHHRNPQNPDQFFFRSLQKIPKHSVSLRLVSSRHILVLKTF